MQAANSVSSPANVGPSTGLAVIILAAGKGTRMRSALHKVLHPVGGRPMLLHLMASVDELKSEHTVVVAGDRAEQVREAIGGRAAIAVQEPQLGTCHAVLMAKTLLQGFSGTVLVLYGDVPLIGVGTLRRLLAAVSDTAPIAVLGFRPQEPGAYGRILLDSEARIEKMVEARDASPAELDVTLCNSGMMAVRSEYLFPLLERVGNANSAGEYYLPDIVMLARGDGRFATVVEADEAELAGVNSRNDLARVEALFQKGRREALMAAGVTLVAPETVFLSHDTHIGQDTLVEPFVVFGPGVHVGPNVVIHSHSHIEGATIEAGAEVGPYARLRPGAILKERSKVGNFVEMKASTLGVGAKANHLTYLGDANIGAGANVGAGTITCNYDGFRKYRTEIGEKAFIGSNSALVAPVVIGDGAIIAAGSTITADVPAGALSVARGKQSEKPGWADRFRSIMQARKG